MGLVVKDLPSTAARKWFTVPVTLTVEVKVPATDDADAALAIAKTLVEKRIVQCAWGEGQPWTARVRGPYTADGPTYGEVEEENG